MQADELTNDDIDKFAEIVRRGGEIICAPDVYPTFLRSIDLYGSRALATRVRKSAFMAPGTICAMSKERAI